MAPWGFPGRTIKPALIDEAPSPGAAVEIVAQARSIGIQVRAGVHTGEVEVRSDDVSGLAIAIAKRICDFGGSGEVLVSGVVPSLVVGSAIEFEDRGEYELKGVPGLWRLFGVAG